MFNEKYKYYFLRENQDLTTALKYLDKNPEKCIIILDKNERFLGTVTDGDIRRALIKGAEFSHSIKNFYFKNSFYIKKKDENITNIQIPKRIITNYKVIPIVNNKKKVIKIITMSTNENNKIKKSKKLVKILNTPIVIMAGGEGKRLLPHTTVIPKPLIPINGKSMIEHVIDRFRDYGFGKFIISLNYKSSLLRAFFSDSLKKTNISFIHEKKPLGTAGSLKMLNKKKINNFFIVNCDSIVRCDYLSLYYYHYENNYDFTIVISKKKHVIPYGSCEITNSGRLKKIHEKPKIDFLANTGVYVAKSKILNLISTNEAMDMNELIEKLLKKKYKVGVFPIHETEWQDLGTWLEFKKFSN